MTFGNPAAIAGVELVVLRLGRLLYSSVVYPVSSCALADIERLRTPPFPLYELYSDSIVS
jgi:hypothetical protein